MTGQGEVARIDRQDDLKAHTLMMEFESLGADCEFGLLQRHYHAEPLGLLRWSSIFPDTLRATLKSRFEGFADPDNLTLSRATWGEYFIKNVKLGIATHTWVMETQTDENAFFAKHQIRMAWLVEKTIENLAAADRIYIYKMRHGTFDQRIVDIAENLRAYGPNRFLCVNLADDEHPAGSVELVSTGFARGFISRHGSVPGPHWKIEYSEWLSVCQKAYDMLPAC